MHVTYVHIMHIVVFKPKFRFVTDVRVNILAKRFFRKLHASTDSTMTVMKNISFGMTVIFYPIADQTSGLTIIDVRRTYNIDKTTC